MSGFESAREAIEEKFGDTTSPDENQKDQPSDQAPAVAEADASGHTKAEAQAIAELDKMDKFKLDGQEWTLKDLKAAIMRQKDYTQKTQSLAETRKTFDESKKFYENLPYDLRALEKNPALLNEFLRVYPKEFHKHAQDIFQANNQNEAPKQNVQQQPQVDVEMMSRLTHLEKFYHEQEVAKNEQVINSMIDKFSQSYPRAGAFKEMVLGRAFEAHSQGVQLNEAEWENIFKQVNSEVETILKSETKQQQKKQMEANAKAKGVSAGGGTAAQAPKKFKNLGEVTDFAVQSLTGRS